MQAGRLARGLPRASRNQFYVPPVIHTRNLPIAPTPIQLPPMSSQEQGVGKSPGWQWPKHTFFQSRKPSAWHRTTWPQRHVVPVGRPEQQGTQTMYLYTYLQRNRHTWPGTPGRIVEYPKSQPLTSFLSRFGR